MNPAPSEDVRRAVAGKEAAGTARALRFPPSLAARLRLYDGVARRRSGDFLLPAPSPLEWPYRFLWPYGRGGRDRPGRPAGAPARAGEKGGLLFGWLYLR
jgi:hypothetical protein